MLVVSCRLCDGGCSLCVVCWCLLLLGCVSCVLFAACCVSCVVWCLRFDD